MMDYDHLQRLGVRRIQLTIVSLLMFMLNKNMIHVFFIWFCYKVCLIFQSSHFPLFLLQEDLLIHGDSVYDIIDKADHGTVQTELLRNSPGSGGNASSLPGEESRLFLCRMNVSRYLVPTYCRNLCLFLPACECVCTNLAVEKICTKLILFQKCKKADAIR